ncbi:putative integral membrane protein [Desulfosalsimonas propionicica]|uniref:Putative integral membrane protein n=1 Tax=Desulfosalsimonas propionicica TaxID=332175 RepID=A0A7W0HL49_9BACT|nr:LapA family protein [Desulfosalsimonas propionicica]MBA2881751.1 putative integral membrane protein [Desulfosalsimonas propionicica]
MKKLKYAFWLLIVVLAAVVVFQNKGFFIVERSFKLNLYFFKYASPELPTALYYFAVFLIGFLLCYFLSLSAKFKTRKTVRQLHEQAAAKDKKIAELESELAAAQAQTVPAEPVSQQDVSDPPETPPAGTEK